MKTVCLEGKKDKASSVPFSAIHWMDHTKPESPVPVFAAGVTVPLESHIGDPLQNVWF